MKQQPRNAALEHPKDLEKEPLASVWIAEETEEMEEEIRARRVDLDQCGYRVPS